MISIQKNTHDFNDLEIACEIANNFFIPPNFQRVDENVQDSEWVVAQDAISLDQALRLIVEERLLLSSLRLKSRACDIRREVLTSKLRGVSPAAKLFYSALALPCVPASSPKLAFCDAHDVLNSAAEEVGLASVDLSHEPLNVVAPNGLMEGELINAFLDHAGQIYRRKSVKNRIERRKRVVKDSLRNAAQLLSDAAMAFQTSEVLEFRLFHPVNDAHVDLETSSMAIKNFTNAALGDDTCHVAVIVWSRHHTVSTGYFYRLWVVVPHTSATAAEPVGLRNWFAAIWEEHGGIGSSCLVAKDFHGDIVTAKLQVKLAVAANHYVCLAPSPGISHFTAARRDHQPHVPGSQLDINQAPPRLMSHSQWQPPPPPRWIR